MSKYYTLITDIGRKKLAQAITDKTTVELSTFVIGDSDGIDYEPTGTETALRRETYRHGINSKDIDPDNIEQIRLELIIPANIGGFYIRELGVYDSQGDLFAIAAYPATYKPNITDGAILKQFIIKMYLQVVNIDNVTLNVTAENLVTRDYVDNTLRSTQQETNTGINNTKYVTPHTLHNKIATTDERGLVKFATDEEVVAIKDDVALSPKSVAPLLVIKPKSITTDKLDDLSVTSEKIANENITTDKIQSKSITTANLANGCVTQEILAINSIVTDTIQNEAISTEKIKPKSITTDKLADLCVTVDKIAEGHVVNSKLQNWAVTVDKIADGHVTPSKIQQGAYFNLGTMAIPRGDGHRMLYNPNFMGLQRNDGGQINGFYFDDFGVPRVCNTGGDNRTATIQNIYDVVGGNRDGIVASGNGWVKFANGLILQFIYACIPQGTRAVTVTLPLAFSNKDSYHGFGSIGPAQSYTGTSDYYGVMPCRITNSTLNAFINDALSRASTAWLSIFCIGY